MLVFFCLFHSLNKDEKENINDFKITEWWCRGDIKVTKQKSTFECYIIKTILTEPRKNYGNDSYIIDLDSPEKTYWLGTESGLLGTFHFDGSGHVQMEIVHVTWTHTQWTLVSVI